MGSEMCIRDRYSAFLIFLFVRRSTYSKPIWPCKTIFSHFTIATVAVVTFWVQYEYGYLTQIILAYPVYNKQVTFVLKPELATNRNFDFIVATSPALPVNNPFRQGHQPRSTSPAGDLQRLAIVPSSIAIHRQCPTRTRAANPTRGR